MERNGGGTFFSISFYSPSASSRHFLFFLNFFFFFTRSDIIVARQDAMDFRPLVFFSLIVFTLSNNPSTFRFLCCRVQRLYLFPGSFLYFVIETIFLFPYVAFSVYHSHPPPLSFPLQVVISYARRTVAIVFFIPRFETFLEY